jgi:AcrR family transcriptional regulator
VRSFSQDPFLTDSIPQAPVDEFEPAGSASDGPGRRKYGSPVMADRRRRILAEAQAMLDELGVEGFTIRELSRRADVAQRTLYNQFGSKEDIVASAIHDHFAGVLAASPPPPPPADFEGHLRRIDVLLDHTIALRRYATAMVAVFFSPSVDRRLYDTLRWISEAGSAAWVPHAVKDGVLTRLSPEDRERLSTLLVNTGYANITDWAADRISADEMRLRFKVNFLICIQAATRPPHRGLIATLIERIRRGEEI